MLEADEEMMQMSKYSHHPGAPVVGPGVAFGNVQGQTHCDEKHQHQAGPDRQESPKPLRDTYAARPFGSSTDGFYLQDRGKVFNTSTVLAAADENQSYQRLSDDDAPE